MGTTFDPKMIPTINGRPMFTASGKRLLYDNGLPFTCGNKRGTEFDKLAFNLEAQRNRVFKRGFASLILVDGNVGVGKTTMVVHLLDYFQGREVVLKDHLYMGGEQFIKGLKICYEKQLVVIGYDESGDFNKRQTLTRLNNTLNRVFEIYRAFKIIVILSLPTMLKLDQGIFDTNIPRMLIRMNKRTNAQSRFSVYDLERVMWIRKHASDKNLVNKTKAYSKVQPNFRGNSLDLPDHRRKELDSFSTSGKLDIVDLVEIKNDGLVTYKEMAMRLNRTHEWVRRKISALGVKPEKTFKGKAYFSDKWVKSLEKIKG
jgi:hypothetical protein